MKLKEYLTVYKEKSIENLYTDIVSKITPYVEIARDRSKTSKYFYDIFPKEILENISYKILDDLLLETYQREKTGKHDVYNSCLMQLLTETLMVRDSGGLSMEEITRKMLNNCKNDV